MALKRHWVNEQEDNNRRSSVDTPWTPFTSSSKLPSTVRSAWKVEEFIIIKKLLHP
ncbi:hypothetical protein DY000_02062912 [Brassica cretica]|uniref:Uncharacterized protein n=1 Tax=Brassica cretica TaxID=69181 RepID=A0ABQ7B0T2_BRACR|nr:hypothetical protein DY000_02062912 [Brassica cretica]